MILGAIGAFIVDKRYTEASAFAAAGAVLTFFGFMHGESVGFAVTPSVAAAYALVAAFLFALSRAPAVDTVAAPTREVPAGVPAE
jgi:AGZA family xanthine/uracil permease-like MFS transporter